VLSRICIAWGYGLLGDDRDFDIEGERVSRRFRQKVSTGGFWQLISNTTDSSHEGFHWFNIAYCCPPSLLEGASDTEKLTKRWPKKSRGVNMNS
jgi:hypothetical protein